ncbi:MAG: RluA family pseudouridine synthase [Phycisphaerales bacterium]|nr:RluA family pseudouridine synthase [Phycisphaerales bacterium]
MPNKVTIPLCGVAAADGIIPLMTQPPLTILNRLESLFPHARKTTLREMIEHKRVRLNGVPVKSLKQTVTNSDKLEVTTLSEAPSKHVILEENLKLVFADTHIVIIDKPAGLLTSTHAKEPRPTALKILSDHFRRQNAKSQIHLIHRLDKDASGLLVFARTGPDFTALKKQFFEHTITRRYDVLVHGIPEKKEDRLENFLLEDEKLGVVHPTPDEKKGKLAILDYVTIQSDKNKRIAHLLCTLFTGRKHQIRVQLKSLGHPVLADPIYGRKTALQEPPHRLALHASHLTFTHPKTKRLVSFDSPMPGSFAHLFRTSGK